MRSVSFRDLQLCTCFEGMNEIDMLNPVNDKKMKEVLHAIGIDTDYAVIYEASLHRDMQNKVAVGFRAIGEIQCNREFVNSDLCSVYERIAVTAYSDPSLTKELCSLQNNSLNYKAFHPGEEDVTNTSNKDFPICLTNDNEKEILEEITMLNNLRDFIRGNCYKEDGSRMTFDEYALAYPDKIL